jgi:uncharacterized RDD family membrane protein YckC
MIPRKYQTFWPRCWARVVDGILFLPLGFMNGAIYQDGVPIWARVCWYVFASLAFVLYVVIMHALFGQTLGKMLTDVRVLDLSEAKLSAKQSFLREGVPLFLLSLAVALGLGSVLAGADPSRLARVRISSWVLWLQLTAGLGWFMAELITMLTNEKRRAVHDFIAGSIVVREKQSNVRESRGVV